MMSPMSLASAAGSIFGSMKSSAPSKTRKRKASAPKSKKQKVAKPMKQAMKAAMGKSKYK
jgi:hypothetical protein